MIWRGENPASTTPGVYFLAFIFVSLLMFSVFSRWWPRRSPSSPQISADLWDAVWRSLPFLHWMSPTEQALLRERSRELLGLKQINGAAGLVLNDHIRLSIALQAALPILHRGCEAYRNWAEIVVYPGDFIIPRQEVDENGVVHEYEETLLGEAWIEGPVLVAWFEPEDGDRPEGINVLIHEFVHTLDMGNGEVDGVPALPAEISYKEWQTTFAAAFTDFAQRLEADPGWAEESPLDPYGAENPGEFLAVMSEHFFETPAALAGLYPDVYRLLARYFGLDPLGPSSPGASQP